MQKIRLVLGAFAFGKDWILNQFRLFSAVVKIAVPSSAVECAINGAYPEKPTNGSSVFTTDRIPTIARQISRIRKKETVVNAERASFFLKLNGFERRVRFEPLT
jgi:hypothetical protein